VRLQVMPSFSRISAALIPSHVAASLIKTRDLPQIVWESEFRG
jgi:hypothetical protein